MSTIERISYRIEREFDDSAHKIFLGWTVPELMAQWMWAGLGTEAWAECNLTIGGSYRVCTNLPGGRHHGQGWSCMCGIFIEIIQDQKLTFTVHWDADVGYNSPEALTLDEVMVVSLNPLGDKTLVTINHLGIPDDGVSASTHQAGLNKSLDHLANVLAT